ncbi:MAG: SIMPL domain-containing protein [Bacteroidetes bacterium]|nr:SIMPL domain-containing protein [Bacteroidota bacterium]
MKNLLFFLSMVITWNIISSQTTSTQQNCCEPAPYIEVTGSAEMEIIPDEIYITVVVTERYDGKNKITIDKLESDMFAALKNIGIEAKNISLSDAESNFNYRFLKSDDALLSRSYTILTADAATVIKVYDAMGAIKATDVFISKVSHSKIEEYRMETKVNATKAAKDKATKMVTAIGETIGSPILLQEINENVYPQARYSQYSNSNFMIAEDGLADFQSQLTYQKIKIRYEVFGKFEIK